MSTAKKQKINEGVAKEEVEISEVKGISRGPTIKPASIAVMEDLTYNSKKIVDGEDSKRSAANIARAHNLPTINLSEFEVSPEAVRLIPKKFCERNKIFPVQKIGEKILIVAFSAPELLHLAHDISQITNCRIQPVIDTEQNIRDCIKKYYSSTSYEMDRIVLEMESVEEYQIKDSTLKADIADDEGEDDYILVSFVNAMLEEAIHASVSDIHIEPYEERLRIRFRLDGTLIDRLEPPQGATSAIISRIKVMARMNISEKRLPQDGRMQFKSKSGHVVDFRVSSLPTLFGEKIVMRILDKSNLQVDMEKLGFEDTDLKTFVESVYLPQGMVLITGPTGSGKTTTIYSALAQRNVVGTNVSTAEDPVEFNIDGMNQVQVKPEIDFTYAAALKAFLRQDPEVIMVGEIRDLETASIAYKAASTGHLVVSTLHTNDAASTVTRLVDIGIPPYIIADSTSLVVAQRLIRKICPKCAVQHTPPDQTLLDLGIQKEELCQYRNLKIGQGCTYCQGQGTAGRIAIFEVMEFNTEIKEGIFKNLSPIELKRVAVKSGMVSLRGSALIKLKRGETTIAEVIHATVRDDE